MSKYDFITIGGATEDITFYTNEATMIDNKKDILRQRLMAFEYGAKLNIEKSYSTFGGGAANAAVTLAKLGFKTAVILAVGSDNRGKDVVANLRKNKVRTSLIQKIPNIETSFTFFVVGRDKEHVGFSNRAANQKLLIGQKELREMNESRWVYVTSLSGKWETALFNIFKTKAKIAWNPGHVQLHAGFAAMGKFLKKTEMLTLNKDEAIELVVSNPEHRNKNNRFLNDSRNLLKIIKGYGPKIVTITNGVKGADAFDGKKYFHQDAIMSNKRVDTTGVGDAFGSTFMAGLEIFQGDIPKAMYAAIRNAAAVISKAGAQKGQLRKDELLKGL